MSALTDDTLPVTPRAMRDEMIVFAAMAVLLGLVPMTGIYPFFVMQALCFALLACAFNLLIGYGGLLSFGHAMFLGSGGYIAAYLAKEGFRSETVAIGGVALPAGISLPPFTPELAILFGALWAGLLGLVVGL